MASSVADHLVFFVNGKKIIDVAPDPELTLLTYLRDNLRLCGMKLGCGEGGCGACTVMVSRITCRSKMTIQHVAVNACLVPACAVHGMAVTTVEGIGSTRTRLHPVQERLAKAHGSQCGFCTPGFVMSMYALLRSIPKPSMLDLEEALQGNLCRCTGYRPIIEGYRTFTAEYACEMGAKCCKLNGNNDVDDVLFEPTEFTPYDATQEPIFPPELVVSDVYERKSIVFRGPRVLWFRPIKLAELLSIKNEYPHAKIIVGNTEVGVEVKYKHCKYPILVMPTQIAELTENSITDTGVVFGSAVTLTEMTNTLNKLIDAQPESTTRLFKAISGMMHYFASTQIRNVASIGGNIMTGSPISDLIPIFSAAGIRVKVASTRNGSRELCMGHGFYTGYRTSALKSDEVLVSVTIPKSTCNQYCLAYKQSKRRDDDIAIVNMALNVTFRAGSDVVQDICIAYGGMAATVVLAISTCKHLIGKQWNQNLLEIANQELISELPLDAGAVGGLVLYRRSLTLSLFFKAYLEISKYLEVSAPNREFIARIDRSGANLFTSIVPESSQLFEIIPNHSKSSGGSVGQPIVHRSAFKQTTGEAVYCDDIPASKDELYLSLVRSERAHAKIVSIDASEALRLPGVQAFFSASDLTAEANTIGDDEVFLSKTVTSQGQTIAAVVADTHAISQEAARLVKVVYEDVGPIIISIEDAIAHRSFFDGFPKVLRDGDVDVAFAEADVIVEGECRLGGQEHFYLETHAALARPLDSDELEVICSTQHPTLIQQMVSHVTGLSMSKIISKSKRVGGGFGGKTSRALLVALPVTLAAKELRRPVRCMLDRDEDMISTGGRHPFLFKYKVCATKEGRIIGCDMQMYSNAGYSLDASPNVLLKAMLHFENTYRIPNVRVQGWLCRTNLPSNTAFRGYRAPQSMMAIECMIRNIAYTTKKTYAEVAELNLYNENDLTPCKQILTNFDIRRCWKELLIQSDYHRRNAEVDEFNRNNRWRKRGITLVPTKFGIGFTTQCMNQSGALVNVYHTDGTVLLSHGGVEMGQGLHTKMIQVASRALEISADRIHIAETATNIVPNTLGTVASTGSDLNGMAVLDACTKIMTRLAPYRKQFPNGGWCDWVRRAYLDRVSLSATGFYKTPDVSFDLKTYTGAPYSYFTTGVACSEVEIDCLTGDHQVLRTDIVMDLGESLNPAIDIGQIEGAFMQGYGYLTVEEMVYSPKGYLSSRGPGAYKVPAYSNIPGQFNVVLLKGSSNPKAVYSSRAVGEPPLFLAASVFFAIREAILAARAEVGLTDDYCLVAPATAARIRMACQDHITEKFKISEHETYTPWNVMP